MGIRWAEVAIEFGMWHEYPSLDEIRSFAEGCTAFRLVAIAECTTDMAGGSPVGSNGGGDYKFSAHADSRRGLWSASVCGVAATRFSESVART